MNTLNQMSSTLLSPNISRASLTYLHEGDWTVSLDGIEQERMTLSGKYYKTFESKGLDFEIVEVKCTSKNDFKTLIKEIHFNPHIRGVAFIHRMPGKGRLTYRIGLVGDYNRSLYALLEQSGVILLGTKYSEGVERWDFVAPFEDGIEDVAHSLSKMGSIIRVDTRKIDFGELEALLPEPYADLSPREQQVLWVAFKRGYYDWPRRVRLKDLALELGVSKSAINESLRRSLKKILGKYLVHEGQSIRG